MVSQSASPAALQLTAILHFPQPSRQHDDHLTALELHQRVARLNAYELLAVLAFEPHAALAAQIGTSELIAKVNVSTHGLMIRPSLSIGIWFHLRLNFWEMNSQRHGGVPDSRTISTATYLRTNKPE